MKKICSLCNDKGYILKGNVVEEWPSGSECPSDAPIAPVTRYDVRTLPGPQVDHAGLAEADAHHVERTCVFPRHLTPTVPALVRCHLHGDAH